MKPLFFLYQTAPAPATTIDGALIVLILAVGAGIPLIINGFLVPLGKAIVTRYNTGTDKKVQELSVFKVLQDEVTRLQEARTEDQKTISKMQGQILELQAERLKDKITINDRDIEIANLQQALQDCAEKVSKLDMKTQPVLTST